ncbi:Wzz/FepE/Etk N-terminal domain-containing protein [Streptomyces tanashiensis]|uniref:Polysaccharide biosynthesis protein n=1 Tax=Streptomyces tanashiensis TaxID=67367 RepID=A0ABY6QQJ1_9ACTN|nr:Wzz/FepE/Etk N-terminal domain-containing protein [Streptomyces tanashiensis]UZX20068.1 polysaccharide biosynthesis protein [Streptomyces tanashiensis]GGY44167.1 membrane-bound polysaccharide biosynthesis protein [Streptomyces tanashiensis]
MSDDTIRLVTIGRILRRRRRLLTILTLVGALVGYGTSLLLPPRYTTSASVLLPGAWGERELLTQTEIATSSVVVDRAAAALGWTGVDGSELREQVTAKAADGNIIKIAGTAETPERAQQLSDQVAQQFVAFVDQIEGDKADPEGTAKPEALRQLVVQTSRRIAELADGAGSGQSVESVQTRTELAKLRTALQEAVDKLEQADPATAKANMVVMGPSVRPTGEAPPTRTQLIAGGALLSFLLTVVGHLAAARMSRRLRTAPEIAAALGAALLGTVDVPDEPARRRAEGRGPRALTRRLLGLDVRWDVPTPRNSGDEAGRQIRYRRVYARLQDLLPVPRRLLVVVPDGDETALRAAGQLVAEAESDASANASGGGYPVLRVVGVSVSRPMVPDRDEEAGAVVVLSASSWTAGELAGVADACADARHAIVGVVLADTVRSRPSRDAGRHRDATTPALVVSADTTGGAG